MNNKSLLVPSRALRGLFVVAAFTLCACASTTRASYDALPKRGTDLSGRWRLNVALSEDAQALMEQRLQEEYRRYAQRRREEERRRPPGMPPEIDVRARERSGAARPWQQRRAEARRRLLEIGDTLTISQSGAQIEIVSAVNSRRLEAGSFSQVSMPQGELADSQVGWDGEWFVIERSVRNGPRVIEKFRLLQSTGQLEYRLAVGGDSELSGLKLRRVYDRAGDAAVARPAAGPAR